jgi:hypothetical protein
MAHLLIPPVSVQHMMRSNSEKQAARFKRADGTAFIWGPLEPEAAQLAQKTLLLLRPVMEGLDLAAVRWAGALGVRAAAAAALQPPLHLLPVTGWVMTAGAGGPAVVLLA